MEAKVINKENLEKIKELNEMLEFYDIDGEITCKELAGNPYIGISVSLPEIEEVSDAVVIDLTVDFTDEDITYKQSVEDLNNEVTKVLKNYRDELLHDVIYDKVGKQIMCKDFEATMLGDTIYITIKL